MSKADLNIIIDKLIFRLADTAKKTRQQVSTLITAFEITPEILQRNLRKSGKSGGFEQVSAKNVKVFTKSYIDTFIKVNTMFKIKYNHTIEDMKEKLFYKRLGPYHLLIIAPNYAALRKAVSNTADTEIFRKSSVGLKRERDKHGKLQFSRDDKGAFIPLLDIGHTSEANMAYKGKTTVSGQKITDVLASPEFLTLKKGITTAVNKSPILAKYIQDLNNIHFDYNVIFKKQLARDSILGKLSLVYTVPQSFTLNRSFSAEEGKVVTDLTQQLVDLKGSFSIMQLIHKFIDNFIFGKKKAHKKHKSTTKVSGSKQVGGKAKINNAKLSSKKQDQVRDAKGRFSSTIKLQTLLNTRLHDQIQSNMGKGSVTEILNYRTGRFAHSANILSVHQQNEKLVANYTFMRYPYDVFMPGGRLYKAGRNPEKLINRSIRQLAIQLVGSKFKVYPKLVEGV